MSDAEESVLSIGAVIGGTTSDRRWENAVRKLSVRAGEVAKRHTAPLNLDVVYHIPGEVSDVDFTGVRTGRYSRKDNLLMVQVAVEAEPGPDPEAEVRALLAAAIDEAERWARKKGIGEADGLDGLRRLADEL